METSASFQLASWNELAYLEGLEPQMTQADVGFVFDGGFKGVGQIRYLMCYQHFDGQNPINSEARYSGLVRFEGELDGQQGSFVAEDRGVFGAGTARSTLTIMPQSGRGELAGISGSGSYEAGHGGGQLQLSYQISD
ncbi:MAG: DUF3224 domain-containing protein [bacterium]|nr:DUF3224 domain-containing protein [bacterium]